MPSRPLRYPTSNDAHGDVLPYEPGPPPPPLPPPPPKPSRLVQALKSLLAPPGAPAYVAPPLPRRPMRPNPIQAKLTEDDRKMRKKLDVANREAEKEMKQKKERVMQMDQVQGWVDGGHYHTKAEERDFTFDLMDKRKEKEEEQQLMRDSREEKVVRQMEDDLRICDEVIANLRSQVAAGREQHRKRNRKNEFSWYATPKHIERDLEEWRDRRRGLRNDLKRVQSGEISPFQYGLRIPSGSSARNLPPTTRPKEKDRRKPNESKKGTEPDSERRPTRSRKPTPAEYRDNFQYLWRKGRSARSFQSDDDATVATESSEKSKSLSGDTDTEDGELSSSDESSTGFTGTSETAESTSGNSFSEDPSSSGFDVESRSSATSNQTNFDTPPTSAPSSFHSPIRAPSSSDGDCHRAVSPSGRQLSATYYNKVFLDTFTVMIKVQMDLWDTLWTFLGRVGRRGCWMRSTLVG